MVSWSSTLRGRPRSSVPSRSVKNVRIQNKTLTTGLQQIGFALLDSAALLGSVVYMTVSYFIAALQRIWLTRLLEIVGWANARPDDSPSRALLPVGRVRHILERRLLLPELHVN